MSKKSILQEEADISEVSTVKTGRPKKPGPFQQRPKKTGLRPSVASPLPKPAPGRRIEDSVKLSTKPSPLQNDPMNIEFDCDDFSGYNELRARRTFTVTNESFIPLVDKEYDLRASTDKRFATVVSRACYRYVNCMHLYARYAQIRSLRGHFDQEEQALLTYLKDKNYSTAPVIDSYLRCIGDFQVDGKHHQLEIPVWPNQTGDFGRVDHNTHWQYMALPAPRILAQAIVQDLRYTAGVDNQRDWDIAEELRPQPYAPDPTQPAVVVRPGLPTANQLGWNRATQLSTDQRVYIEDAGITIDGFGGRGRFCINNRLIERVHDALNGSAAKIKLGGAITERPFGSPSQLIWLKREFVFEPSYNRIDHYMESELRGNCMSSVEKRVGSVAHIFGLRASKDNYVVGDQERRLWCCYQPEV
ncbi:uncharacterized protein LOC143208528 [Lasioglossum baleicum]|uniref:uncharacterized protein LOC143208528 n=1 Tax=Lasioglossum baleicum TaxID=434251 RepID=UPI003FCC8D77